MKNGQAGTFALVGPPRWGRLGAPTREARTPDGQNDGVNDPWWTRHAPCDGWATRLRLVGEIALAVALVALRG